MFNILVSRTFQKQFKTLPKSMQKRVITALAELEDNPFEPRSGANINELKNTKPQKYRIRIGDYRIVYLVLIDKNIVKVIEIFQRGRGYRKQ